jgi:hypothetical protein
MAEQPPGEREDLECVAELRDGLRADLCQMALEAAGIQAWLCGRHLATVAPHLAIAVGVRVLVRTSEVLEAREALNDLASGSAALPQEIAVCPHCGSTEVAFVGKPARVRALVDYIVFGIPRPDVRWTWHCTRCGNEWA